MTTSSKTKYREWVKNNPEKVKEISERYRKTEKYRKTYVSNHLRRTYGISYDDYFAIYSAQGEACAICGRSELRREQSGKRKQILPLFVDHDHTTGKVRGLLCSKCNSGLGMFEDNIDSLITAISYLKEYQS